MKMFDNNFDKVLGKADMIFQLHNRKKGETWKEMPIDALASGIKEEYEEWMEKWHLTLKGLRDNKKEDAKDAEEDQFFEILDMINSCLMYAERLRMRMEKRKKSESKV